MTTSQQYQVHPDGAAHRLDGRKNRPAPELIRLAQGFLRSGCPSVVFSYISDRWSRVVLTAEPRWALMTVTEGEPPYALSVRELDVLTLVAGGLSNTVIARYLGTSPRTVSKQVESVLDKMGQPNRVAAAAFGIDHGLLRLPIPGACPELSALSIGMVDRPRAPPNVPDRGLHRCDRQTSTVTASAWYCPCGVPVAPTAPRCGRARNWRSRRSTNVAALRAGHWNPS